MKVESYQEMKKRHSDEFGKFKGIFFAFSDEQLKEGIEKIRIAKNERVQLISIGSGGYIRKDSIVEFKSLLNRHTVEHKNRLKDKKALIEALSYELMNHEYDYTRDPEQAIEALGLNRKDISEDILKKAIKQSYNQHCIIN